MMLEDGAVPGGGVDVGVDFGGEDAFVSQHFLDHAQVGAVFNEMRREGVAEGVRRDFFLYAGRHRLFFDQLEDGYAT